jgi:hypothetical protein
MTNIVPKEYQSLRSQNVTLKRGQHSKYLPFVFTEQGVAMLSSVLEVVSKSHLSPNGPPEADCPAYAAGFHIYLYEY